MTYVLLYTSDITDVSLVVEVCVCVCVCVCMYMYNVSICICVDICVVYVYCGNVCIGDVLLVERSETPP